jgi:hypothetical protein
MERKKVGPGLILIGTVLFILSLFVILPIPTLYLASLFLMFIAVILIGVGAAFAKGVDSSLDIPLDECYYCDGTGKKGIEVCPRCGGSGHARPDDE